MARTCTIIITLFIFIQLINCSNEDKVKQRLFKSKLKAQCCLQIKDKKFLHPLYIEKGLGILKTLPRAQSFRLFNSTNLCALSHFLIQNAHLNRKQVNFKKGTFIIDDFPANIQKILSYLNQRIVKINGQTKLISKIISQPEFPVSILKKSELKWLDIKKYPGFVVKLKETPCYKRYEYIHFGELPTENKSVRIYFKLIKSKRAKLKSFITRAFKFFNRIIFNPHSKPNETEFEEIPKLKQLSKLIKKCGLSKASVQRYGISYITKAAKNCKYAERTIHQWKLKYGDSMDLRYWNEIIFHYQKLLNSPPPCTNSNTPVCHI
ncbi:hypothetical protein GJ496_008337 [Pomphorhynchus laevis]|nr:hypothetical protein GJ496_008337 [Pomphorhynchus laevis]